MIREDARRPVLIWLASGALLIFFMVLIGGITRLTGSGLSMVDWNLIMGAIPPTSEIEWKEAFEQYKQFPEFQIQPADFGLESFKAIFFWEYLHRNLGRLIGLVFILPFAYFIFTKRIQGAFVKKLLILLFLGGFQGFLGWYMVKSGLVNDPHVSHFRLAAHLITAFSTFAYTWWLILQILLPTKMEKPFKVLRNFTIAFLIILFVQITWGAFVAGLKAGLFYNSFPKMGDRWIAEGVFAMQPLYKNFLEGIAGVQFIHRYVAIVIFFFELFFFAISFRYELSTPLKGALKIGFLAVIVQELLGIFTLLYAVPLSLGLLHQIGAFILLTVLIYILRLTAFEPSRGTAIRSS